jgi:LysM repeat protein
MEGITTNSSLQPPTAKSAPKTIAIYPWQRLEDQPIAALLSLIPRLRGAYDVHRKRGRLPIATSRSYYQIIFENGAKLDASDNLVDVLALIDGQRTIQTICNLLAEQQARPVHPAEIVYLLRSRLIPAGLAELMPPQALPAPRQTRPLQPSLPNKRAVFTRPLMSREQPPQPDMRPKADTLLPTRMQEYDRLAPQQAPIEWIPESSRASRLRKRRLQAPLGQRTHRTSLISLVATLLIVLAAGAAFAYGQTNFSHASFTPPSLSSLFGPLGPTATVQHRVTPTPQHPLAPIHYPVQERDTLEKIAKHFHVTVQALMLINNLSSPDAIQPDQILIIPTVYRQGEDVSTLAHPIFYIVQQGDSIYSIGQLFGTPSDKIIQMNHIADPALIQPGDALVIP